MGRMRPIADRLDQLWLRHAPVEPSARFLGADRIEPLNVAAPGRTRARGLDAFELVEQKDGFGTRRRPGRSHHRLALPLNHKARTEEHLAAIAARAHGKPLAASQ